LKINLIVAVSENNVIGMKNNLPWTLPNDMRYFKEKTLGHCVIMGKKNYLSIPQKFRPLPNRENIILTTKKNFNAPKCKVFNTLEKALEYTKSRNEKEIFVIGGGEVYKYALEKNLIDTIFLTRVHAKIQGDTFFPKLNKQQWNVMSEEKQQKDENHKYDYTFFVLTKN
jgi:dihydrofolate reductase